MTLRIHDLQPEIITKIYLALDRYSALSLSLADRYLNDLYTSESATLLNSSLERAGKIAKPDPASDDSSLTAPEKLARLYRDEDSWIHMKHFKKSNKHKIRGVNDSSLTVHDLDEGVLAAGEKSSDGLHIKSVTCYETKEGRVVTRLAPTESEDVSILGVALSLRDYDLIVTVEGSWGEDEGYWLRCTCLFFLLC